jgi:hypothetical protein
MQRSSGLIFGDTPSMPSLDLSLAGLTIRVETADPSDLEWLEENLTPSFCAAVAESPLRIVTKTVDPGRHRALLERGPASPVQQVTCFGFDGHGGACTRWSAAPTTLYDDELGVFYELNEEGSRVEVVAPSARPSTRIALLRLVREFAAHHLAAQGVVQIHAAALEHNGRGILIVGPKRAGKTSLLIHSLREAGSLFIANDRAVVSGDSQVGWRLGGMPTLISIRPGTVKLLHRPGFLAASRWSARMTLTEALGTPADGPPASASRQLSISPRQFCHAVDAGRVESAPLRAIVFPRVDTGRDGLQFSRLSAAGMGERLRPHLLDPADTVFRSDLAGARSTAASAEVLAGLQAVIPAFECVLGQQAFSSGSACSLLFAELDRTTDGPLPS